MVPDNHCPPFFLLLHASSTADSNTLSHLYQTACSNLKESLFPLCTLDLFLLKFFLFLLFWIAETRASFSSLPLCGYIDCGNCIVTWVLHVCVPSPLYFPSSCSLLFRHLFTPHRIRPLFTFSYIYTLDAWFRISWCLGFKSPYCTPFTMPSVYLHSFVIHCALCLRNGWASCQWPHNPYSFPHNSNGVASVSSVYLSMRFSLQNCSLLSTTFRESPKVVGNGSSMWELCAGKYKMYWLPNPSTNVSTEFHIPPQSSASTFSTPPLVKVRIEPGLHIVIHNSDSSNGDEPHVSIPIPKPSYPPSVLPFLCLLLCLLFLHPMPNPHFHSSMSTYSCFHAQ